MRVVLVMLVDSHAAISRSTPPLNGYVLTGQVPFIGANALDVLTKVVAEAPAPPRLAAPHMAIPSELEDAVLRAIEKEPRNRFQSLRELAEGLASIPISRPRAQMSKPERSDREELRANADSPAGRRELLAAVMVLTAVVFLLAIALVALLWSR